MKLYTANRAPNPKRIDLFLAAHQTTAAQLNIQTHFIDLATTENKTPDFLQINPLGLLPVLQLDDGTVINESIAICRYIESVLLPNDGIKLFGNTALEQVLIEQMNRIAEYEVLTPMTYAFQMSHPFWVGKKQQCPDFAPIAHARVLAGYDYFNQHLSQHSFIVNNTLSIADLTLYTALDFARLAKPRIDEQHPHLLAYYQRLAGVFA